MANPLAELFQDQANAIREGLGDIGKIAPADFPNKTREIVELLNQCPEIAQGVAIYPDFSEGDYRFSFEDGTAITGGVVRKPEELVPENIVKGVSIANVVGTAVIGEDIELLNDVIITPDFSNGDQELSVPDGYAVKSGAITKPDTLVPENIVEGVNISGIVGSASVGSNLELLEGVPVEPDFSEGDFTLSAPDGYAVKSATVLKPDTLKPENILEGVTIAGILGTLSAGSGGSAKTPVAVRGEFSSPDSNAIVTETHGLGCRPDIIFIWTEATIATGKLELCIATSVAFKQAFTGASGMNISHYIEKNGNNTYGGQCFDQHATRNAYVHDQWGMLFVNDDTTFQIGCANPSRNALSPKTLYKYWVIGGLT